MPKVARTIAVIAHAHYARRTSPMKLVLSALCLVLCTAAFAEDAPRPLKALLVTGGCCHDYEKQKTILQEGLARRIPIDVKIVHEGGSSTKHMVSIYSDPNWAKGYDVVIHDECFADVKDLDFVSGILKPHQGGVPSVNLHCAMHCYRTGTDDWFKFIGIQSTGHGPQLPIEITFTDTAHPITKGLANWTTIKEELYNNVKLFETAHPLARGKQANNDFVVVWTNDYNGTRVFNTTIGHNNETVADDRYLDLVARGVLWACDKLDSTGKAKPGYGK
jgi:type 1 glutamine amidotransferase